MVLAAMLLFASQPAQVVVIPAQPPPELPTARTQTTPAFDLACSLVDAALRPHALAIEQRGGRGYVDPRVDHPQRRVTSTRLTFRVLRDDTGLFSDDSLIGVNDGSRLQRIEGRHPQFGFVRLETFLAGRQRLAALVYVNGLAEVRYTGFCAVTRHAQTPLTEAEAAEVLHQ